MDFGELATSLVYEVSSRAARATQGDWEWGEVGQERHVEVLQNRNSQQITL